MSVTGPDRLHESPPVADLLVLPATGPWRAEVEGFIYGVAWVLGAAGKTDDEMRAIMRTALPYARDLWPDFAPGRRA